MQAKIFIFFIFSALLFQTKATAQWTTKDATQFQTELNEWYASEEHSPFMNEEMRTSFESLNFFKIDDDFIVEASFKKLKAKKAKNMPTSSGKYYRYINYGIVTFELNGENYELTVLKSEESDEEFADYLTIPFLDDTNGTETYGGGRYLGIWIDDIRSDETVILNFNLAYHPYCAYVSGYSCLLPPRNNYIAEEITAGVKNGLNLKH